MNLYEIELIKAAIESWPFCIFLLGSYAIFTIRGVARLSIKKEENRIRKER